MRNRSRQECAEVRHTTARGLDTEKVRRGVKNMSEVCKTESQYFTKSRPQIRKYVRTHLFALFQT